MRFIQHSPDLKDFDVQVSAGGSSTQHASGLNDAFDLVLNLPIAQDVFGLRLNADYSHDAGYIAQNNLYVLDSAGVPVPKDPTHLVISPALMTSRRGTNDNTYKSGRIAALWKPTDNVRVDLNVYHQEGDAGNTQTITPLLTGWDSLDSAHYIPEALTDRVDLQSLEIGLDLGFATFTSTTSHFKHENVSTGDYTTYKISDDTMVYATYAQGFRRGGINALPGSTLAGGKVDSRFKVLKPDYAYNSEVGLKGSIAKQFQYSVGVYSINWKDIQSGLYLTPLSIISTANIGDGYSRGVELEFSGKLIDQLYTQVGYSYDSTKLTTASFQALNATVPSAAGGQLPDAPTQTLSVSLDYKIPLGGEWVLDPTIAVYYRGAMVTTTTPNRFPVGGFTTTNVSMNIDYGHWHGLVYINNATNKLGFNSAPNTDTWGQGAAVLVNQPRTAGVMVTYKLSGK